MAVRFSELRKVPKGKQFPENVHGEIKQAIQKNIKDEQLLKLFELAELNKWFGCLKWPSNENPLFAWYFRYGVCNRWVRYIGASGSDYSISNITGSPCFELSVINDEVTFSGGDNA